MNTNRTSIRSNGKPNSARRVAIRESLPAQCMTCTLPLCWSAQTDDKSPHKGTFGHVVAEEVGGTWDAGNIGAQCWSCNWAAKCRGIHDLSGDVTPGSIPAKYLPTKAVTSDRRTNEPDTDAARYGKQDRANARKARGLDW